MKLLPVCGLLLSLSVHGQQGSVMTLPSSQIHSPYAARFGLQHRVPGDSLMASFRRLQSFMKHPDYSVTYSPLDHMPVIMPDKKSMAFMPNPFKGETEVEPMPNPALPRTK